MYLVSLSNKAEKGLAEMPAKERTRMLDALDGLQTQPRPPGCKKLKGYEKAYRIRAGNYRAIYEVEDAQLVVLVVTIAHRREVYE